MLTIRTEFIEDNTKVRATGANTSSTIRYAKTQSDDRNHAKALGHLLNKVLHSEQQAKLRHPSGGQRVRVSVVDDHLGAIKNGRDWYIDV